MEPNVRSNRWDWGSARDYLSALGVVVACVLIASILKPLLPLANLSLVFLVGVLLLSVRASTVPTVLTALVSAAAYNFFFTQPHYSFHMYHTEELLTVGFFLLIGLLAGHVAGRLRRQMAALRALNAQNQTLADLNQRLATAPDLPTIATAAGEVISERFRMPVRVWLANRAADGPALSEVARFIDEDEVDQNHEVVANWSVEHCQTAGRMTASFAESPWRFLPLLDVERSIGVVAIRFPAHSPPSEELLHTVDLVVNQVSLAMARACLAEDLEQASIAEETERLRSALLSSVSHDLRTPLASMIGSATSLRDLHCDLSDADRAELLDAIISEGERLNRYIQNLLDMTKLGHGGLEITRDWIGLEDILNAAIRRTGSLLGWIRVVRSVDPELPLLYVHPALIEQAIVNVIENAARFSPEDGEIRISGELEFEQVHIVISDDGPGIPVDLRRKVFEMHFTGGDADGDLHGGGLGLAICAGMVAAHMGRVEAHAGSDGRGTSIHIYLPAMTAPPAQGG